MPLTNISTFNTPGVYVQEGTYGAVPTPIASHSAVYMLGYSSKAGAPVNTPTFITSPNDFYNQFGTSASANSVQLFFDQRSSCGMYFINVPIKTERSVSIGTVTAGAVYSLIIDSYVVSYTALSTDMVQDVLNGLTAAVNTQAPHIARMYTNGKLRTTGNIVVSASANITLGAAATGTSYPTAYDVVDCINSAFSPEMMQGFLLAPEFFQSFTAQADRTTVALAMEALASDPSYYWIAVIDCGLATATQTNAAGAVNLAIAERNALQSPNGNSCYFFPYWVNMTGQLVPMSASVVGEALRRWRQQGFIQPPAGVAFPVYGVLDISYPVTAKVQAQLNPLGINCGRYLANGRGRVIYGARSLATDGYHTFMTTRVILNVLAGTLRTAYDSILFSMVDGQGLMFSRIKQTAVNLCEQLRTAGALYGATSQDAYLVICDYTNNPASSIQNGQVNLDVIVKVSPIVEVLVARLNVTSLGTVLAELQAAGTTSAISQPAATTASSGTTLTTR